MGFVCSGDDSFKIPKDLEKQYEFPKCYFNKENLLELSISLKEFNKDSFFKLPFCNTLEIEALGGKIVLGDGISSPRSKEYAFKSLEELKDNLSKWKNVELKSERIDLFKDLVKFLSLNNNKIVFSVQGPFTIICSLIDPKIFYKLSMKNPEEAENILKLVEDIIIRFAKSLIDVGVNIISYGDVMGLKSIVGKRVYDKLSAFSMIRVIKELIFYNNNINIHLCGKMSNELIQYKYAKLHEIEVNDYKSYGDALLNLNIYNKIIGLRCINTTNRPMNTKYIYELILN